MRIVPINLVFRDGSKSGAVLPQVQPVTLSQGEDSTLIFTCVGENGAAWNLTGFSLTLGIKVNLSDATPIINRSITITSATSGIAQAIIVNGDTIALPPRQYTFSVLAVDGTAFDWQPMPVSPLLITATAAPPGGTVTPPGAAMALVGLPPVVASNVGQSVVLSSISPTTLTWGSVSPVYRWTLAKTWATVWAEVLAVASGGNPIGVILVDCDDIGTVRQMTAGTYQFRNISFRGISAPASPAGGPTINMQSGVLLDNSTGQTYIDAEQLNIQTNAAITRALDNVNIALRYFAGFAGVVGTFPQTAAMNVILERGSLFNSSFDPLGLPVSALVDFTAGGSVVCSAQTGSRIGAGAFGGAVAATVQPVMDALSTNVSGYPVSAWATGSPFITATFPQGLSPTARVKYRVSDGAIAANTFVKFSATTDYRVIQAAVTDTRDNISGVALDAAAGAGTMIRVVEERGQQVDVKTDGVGGGTVPRGSLVDLSSTTAGYCKLGVGSMAGRVVKQATNTANVLVRIVI